jgi:hypothetical protein
MKERKNVNSQKCEMTLNFIDSQNCKVSWFSESRKAESRNNSEQVFEASASSAFVYKSARFFKIGCTVII